MKELKELRYQVEQIANRQKIRLWRLARNAEKHGVSRELVNAIREEGWTMHEYELNPDRLLRWQTEYELKYAFKAV